MNKYNPEELNAAIEVAVIRGVKDEGMYNSLIFMPDNEMNDDGYVNAKRFGYNDDTEELDYLGDTDVMPWNIDYKHYRMDFVPGGINIYSTDMEKFKVSSMCYYDTVIG